MRRSTNEFDLGKSLDLYHKPPRHFSRYVNGTPVYHCRELHTFRDSDLTNQQEKQDRLGLIQVYREQANLGLDLFDDQHH